MRTKDDVSDTVRDSSTARTDEVETAETEQTNVTRRPRSAIVALRMASEEVAALERAAEQASESTSDYVRKAIGLRQSGLTIPPTVNISSGSFGVQVNRLTWWTEAQHSYTPDDVPPLTEPAKKK